MGYFNYFIKCIIRNFAYNLCKPKVFLTFLLCCLILFGLHTKGYCAEWAESDIDTVLNQLTSISNDMTQQIAYLYAININVTDLENTLNTINTTISNIKSDTSNISINISSLLTLMSTVNSNILNIYNELDENQRQLLTELEENNQQVLNELNMIRDSLNGTENESTSYIDLGIVNNSRGEFLWTLKSFSIDYEPRYVYTVKVYYNNPYDVPLFADVFCTNNEISQGFIPEDYSGNFLWLQNVPAYSNDYVVTYTLPSSNFKYIYFTWGNSISHIEVYRSIPGIVESLTQNNDLQQQQNQLQQQQNQLQQEQNNFLQQGTSDSDVSVDSFNNVNANDITSDGLTGVFTNIYNSINSWSSKDINLPIPHTNKNITIPANYTQNMLSSFGGVWIITFISSIYYFIVARFIIYSITGIINSIKSGSILETDSKNNITTDML